MLDRTISHYKVTTELGRGGMGVVYKAEDTNLKRPVALKFLAAHLLGDEEVKARFRREAEAAAALNHPNVCHVYEISEVEGKTFIAMAFLEGEPLEKKIEAGPLKLKEALDFAIQTAKGLQAAHGKKIVHRDIKPANLMIGEDGHVTIMDFGLALLADRSKLTRLDETMGTVTYMSPEQTYGMELDHRTDVWSLGVVIYEMVTGQRPFKGHYDQAVTYSITSEEPEPMTGLRTGVPMELELLVNKCLAKEADRRYQSIADMVVGSGNTRREAEVGAVDNPTRPGRFRAESSADRTCRYYPGFRSSRGAAGRRGGNSPEQTFTSLSGAIRRHRDWFVGACLRSLSAARPGGDVAQIFHYAVSGRADDQYVGRRRHLAQRQAHRLHGRGSGGEALDPRPRPIAAACLGRHGRGPSCPSGPPTAPSSGSPPAAN